MAIFHLSVKTGSKSNGQSAKAKAQYILRVGRYQKNKAEVMFSLSGNMPEWASQEPLRYWEAADTHERSNGRLYKEVDLAIPVELTLEQQREMIAEFVNHQTEDEHLPYLVSGHRGKGHNPHCHWMISERMHDGINRPAEQWFRRYNSQKPEKSGARKTESLKPKEWLERIRKDWAEHVNQALERAGHHDVRIDHRSLEAQGIDDRLPQIHLGTAAIEMEENGILTDRAERALEIVEVNAQLQELKLLEKEIYDERLGEGQEISEHAARNPRTSQATPAANPTVRPSPGSARSRKPSPEKTSTATSATENRKAKPIRPISRQVSRLQGGADMLSASEYQKFLLVRRLMAQQQEDERKQKHLSEAQKQRVEKMIQLAEAFAGKRKDQLYLEDYFAQKCLEELHQRKQTVEQVTWRDVEVKVAAELLVKGATTVDMGAVLAENGISVVLDQATLFGDQIAGEKQVMEYLKTFAAGKPDLLDAIEQAEGRQKEDGRDVQREQRQKLQPSPPRG